MHAAKRIKYPAALTNPIRDIRPFAIGISMCIIALLSACHKESAPLPLVNAQRQRAANLEDLNPEHDFDVADNVWLEIDQQSSRNDFNQFRVKVKLDGTLVYDSHPVNKDERLTSGQRERLEHLFVTFPFRDVAAEKTDCQHTAPYEHSAITNISWHEGDGVFTISHDQDCNTFRDAAKLRRFERDVKSIVAPDVSEVSHPAVRCATPVHVNPKANIPESNRLELVLRLDVSAKGRLRLIEVTKPSGNAGFDASIISALRRCTFEPAYRDLLPVDASLRTTYVWIGE